MDQLKIIIIISLISTVSIQIIAVRHDHYHCHPQKGASFVTNITELNVLVLYSYLTYDEMMGTLAIANETIHNEALLPGIDIKFHPVHACIGGQQLSPDLDAVYKYTKEYDRMSRRNTPVHLTLGPHCSDGMRLIGQLSAAYNRPLSGYMSISNEFGNRDIYKTLVRTSIASANGPVQAVVRLMGYYGWKQIGLITNTDNFVADGFSKAINKELASTSNMLVHEVHLSKDELNRVNTTIIAQAIDQIRKHATIILINIDFYPCTKVFNKFIGTFYNESHVSNDTVLIVPYFTHTIQCDFDPKWFQNSIIVEAEGGGSQTAEIVRNKWTAAGKNVSALQLPQYLPPVYAALYLWATAVRDELLCGDGDITNGTVIREWSARRKFRGMTTDHQMDDRAELIPIYTMSLVNKDGSLVQFMTVKPKVQAHTSDTYWYKMEATATKWAQKGERFWFRNNSSLPSGQLPRCGYRQEKCPFDWTLYLAALFLFTICLVGILVYAVTWHRRQRLIDQLPWLLSAEELKRTDVIVSNSSSGLQSHMASISSQIDLESALTTITTYSIQTYRGKTLRVREERLRSKLHLDSTLNGMFTKMSKLSHDSIADFVGICPVYDQMSSQLLFCYLNAERGSLSDIVFNENLKLASFFQTSFIHDVAKGLDYIHSSAIEFHGNLCLETCLVSKNWNVKLSEFGLTPIFEELYTSDMRSHPPPSHNRLLATAPEILKTYDMSSRQPLMGNQKADVYSLGLIMYQIVHRCRPFPLEHSFEYTLKQITTGKLRATQMMYLTYSTHIKASVNTRINDVVSYCVRYNAVERPRIKVTLRALQPIMKETTNSGNIIDHMISMMDSYADNLEKIVQERTALLEESQRRAEFLLHQMLPKSVVQRLQANIPVPPQTYELATVCFADIVGFTTICSCSSPLEIVNLLNTLFSGFDQIIGEYDVYKVETIGDAYMIVSGVPTPNENHAVAIAKVALQMNKLTSSITINHIPELQLMIRTGMASGSVAAGVVGVQAPRYCLFGDTVNVASRMESTGEPMKIQIDPNTHSILVKTAQFLCSYRGVTQVKGKGSMDTYWLEERPNHKI